MVAGRPLVSYPVGALAGVCDRVAVVCKEDTELPELPGVERWDEPAFPVHPLAGIAHALERAHEAVLVCAADMPFVTADACRSLLGSAPAGGGGGVAVAVAAGVLQPVFGVYSPLVLDTLRAADSDAALTSTVESLDPVRVALPPAIVRSVNTPEDLREAEAAMGGR